GLQLPVRERCAARVGRRVARRGRGCRDCVGRAVLPLVVAMNSSGHGYNREAESKCSPSFVFFPTQVRTHTQIPNKIYPTTLCTWERKREKKRFVSYFVVTLPS